MESVTKKNRMVVSEINDLKWNSPYVMCGCFIKHLIWNFYSRNIPAGYATDSKKRGETQGNRYFDTMILVDLIDACHENIDLFEVQKSANFEVLKLS